MRILHTVEFYYPHIGGAEEVVRQISERLAKKGHKVTVATSADVRRDFEELNGVRIRQFDIKGNLVKGIQGEIKPYTDLLKSGRFDVIMNYAAQTWTTDITLSLLSQLPCAKLLAPCGYSGLIGIRQLFYRDYFKKLPRYLRQYDAIIYHSAQYIDKIFGDCHGIANYEIIPHGVDSKEFQGCPVDFRNSYSIQTPFLLLTVGSHYRVKGHDRVIKAFERLERQDVTLVIVGRKVDNWYRSCWKSCRRRVNRNPRIILLDDASRSHTIAAFLAADLFLLGSRVEAFPLVILEAMASRTPFITFDVGNVMELRGGRVVKSVREMVSQVETLLENDLLRSSLGNEGYQEQQAYYDWDIVIDRYEDLYYKTVNQHTSEDGLR